MTLTTPKVPCPSLPMSLKSDKLERAAMLLKRLLVQQRNRMGLLGLR